MKSITCSTHVWVRDVGYDAGTMFKVVAEPKAPKEIDQTLADAWERNGWVKKATAAATEGA